jgi:hypothetical protein
MPALSFQEAWINKLLRGDKQQTTRPQTDRIKVGNIVSIYNQQRKKIFDKPLRSLTDEGYGKMEQLSHKRKLNYPAVPFTNPIRQYPAHFLGRVGITEVYDMLPLKNSSRSAWAKADGFDNFTAADTWFTSRYGDDWMNRWWTVIRWDGWMERYFEPEG